MSVLPNFPRTDFLDDVVDFVRSFVVLDDRQADAVALWVAHTHAAEAADTTPYLLVSSAEKRSGKTRLLEVLELVVHQPRPRANISDAALPGDRPVTSRSSASVVAAGGREPARQPC
ncbi:MAG TPA: hypothetical protein VGJ40_01625 [Gaiellaceae bacterium]